ncbi:MAG: tetratricopeptide repeat protein [Pseudomonadota bacterium]|nr:tetratricopeptide repeat protein [Pseudomonadota bacterium]
MLVFLLPRARALKQRLERADARRTPPQTLQHEGRSVSVRVCARPTGIPQFVFATPIARQPPLQIRPLGWLDRLGRRCGLARVAASGDAEFDRRVLVSCDYRELAAVALREPATRAAVLALMDAQVCSLNFGNGQLTAYFDASGDPADRQDLLEQHAALLRNLAEQQAAFVGTLSPMTPFWPIRRIVLLMGCALLPLLAMGACALLLELRTPLDLQAVVVDALKLSPLWWLGTLVPALVWLRGHPTSAQLLPATLVATTLAAAPAAIAFHLARNGSDAEAARDVVVAVTGSVMLSGTRSPTLRWSSTALQRRGLFGAPHSLSAQVGELQWHDTPIARARLHARIAPGALGHPWLVSVVAEAAAENGIAAVDNPLPSERAIDAVVHGPQPQLALRLPMPGGQGAALLAQAKSLYTDGELPVARQRLDQALAQLDREGAPATIRADAYWYRATIYSSLGAPFERQQEMDARTALTIMPGHTGAALLLDDVLFRSRRYSEALQLWEVVLAQKPEYQYGHYKRAQLLATLGVLSEARVEAQTTCRLGERAACDLADSF